MHITSVAARVIDSLQIGFFGCAAQKHSTTQGSKIVAELALGCRVAHKKIGTELPLLANTDI